MISYLVNGAEITLIIRRSQKLNPFLIPNTKINSIWIKDLNLKPSYKNLGRQPRKYHSEHRHEQRFYDKDAKKMSTKAKIDK